MKIGAKMMASLFIISSMIACACLNDESANEEKNANPQLVNVLQDANLQSQNASPDYNLQPQNASPDCNSRLAKIEIRNALVIGKVEDGLGDVNWTINIANELKAISTAKVTSFFYGVGSEAENHLMKRSEFSSFEMVDSFDKVEPVEDKGYSYKIETDNEAVTPALIGTAELKAFLERYDFIVFFHSHAISTEPDLVGRVIVVSEYGQGDNGSKIFFKDYKAMHGGNIDEGNGYMKLMMSAEKYREGLPKEKKGNFRLDYIGELEDKINGQPYYFSYYNVATRTHPFILKYMISSLDTTHYYIGACAPQGTAPAEPILLSNIDLRKAAEMQMLFYNYSWVLHGVAPQGPASAKDDEAVMSELLKNWNCMIGADGKIASVEFGEGKRMKLISYDTLSPEEFEYMLLKSEYVMGCTGDMSATQALSSGRMMVYETRMHKQHFYDDLNCLWKEVGSQPDNANFSIPAMDCIDYYKKDFAPCPNLQEMHRAFLEKLRGDSFQKWFKARLLSALDNEGAAS